MQHLFITDPFSLLVPGHDSTLALMRNAIECEHEVWQCEMKDIRWDKNQVIATGKQITKGENILVCDSQKKRDWNLNEKKLPIVWMRKDPPVDNAYIRTCQLLRLTTAKVLNNPDVLMACDEKLFALEFPELIPETYISQDRKYLRQLVNQHQRLIAKPVGNKGGEGIFMLSAEDKNLGSLLDMMTLHGHQPIILQEYLPAIKEGDKRIFLLAGDPLGAVMRIPQANDHRANMAAGGSIIKTPVTENDRKICARIKPRLLELGMYIVGIDVIGDKLTEINITSPTCLEEIGKLDNTNPALEIIRWSESL